MLPVVEADQERCADLLDGNYAFERARVTIPRQSIYGDRFVSGRSGEVDYTHKKVFCREKATTCHKYDVR